MEEYHRSTTSTVTPTADRRLGPYEYVATPPIQLVLDAILARCDVGGCITPGIRQLADWSGVSRGQITAHLRQLDVDGWICYDGRVIMLLRHPDDDQASDRSADRSPCEDTHEVIDQLIDHPEPAPEPDRSTDRSPVTSPAHSFADRVLSRRSTIAGADRHADRSVFPPAPHGIMTHEQQESAVALKEIPTGGMQGGCGAGALTDRQLDRSPATQLLAELGADEAIIAGALAARPDLTPEQIRATWAWHAWRRERDPGLGEGIFFKAIRNGQVHAAPPDPQQPIPVEAYIQADPAFCRRGDDLAGVAPPTPAVGPIVARPELRDLAPPPRAAPTSQRPVRIAPAYVPPKWQRRQS